MVTFPFQKDLLATADNFLEEDKIKGNESKQECFSEIQTIDDNGLSQGTSSVVGKKESGEDFIDMCW